MTIIGGHAGLKVSRENGVIVKEAHAGDGKRYQDIAIAGLGNAARMLRIMAGSGWAPELLEEEWGRIAQTDAGISAPITNEQMFRRQCVRLLHALRQRNVRHGDLTYGNLVVCDNRPMAIDWQEAHLIGEPAPQKQPWSDSYLLCRDLATVKDENGNPDPSRIVRRWLVVLQALGADKDLSLPLRSKSFLDLGCFQGDHVAWAAAEGMVAEGVDYGGFRSGEDSITIATDLWENMNCTFTRTDMVNLPAKYFSRDVVMCFSAWPYVVKQHGKERAERWLQSVIEECEVLFFETQLYGDGPGPDFLRTGADVGAMLARWGRPKLLASFAVYGRDATRSVWEVRH